MLRRCAPYLPVLIAGLALLARLLPTPRTIDDAYITFRYARNLLAGAGFVYNVGEQVLGTTTPLYTLLMAGLAAVPHAIDYPWLALGVNALADGLTCLLLVRLGERLTGGRAAGLAAALVWAVAPMSVSFAIGGMETSVFVLLLVLTADLYLAGRARLAALTAALLLLTRPDGLIFVGPLVLDQFWLAARARRPKLLLAPAGVFLAGLAPWLIFASLYFGSPLPNSIAAKALAYRLPPEAAFVRLIQHYGTPFLEHLVLGNFWPLAGFALYVGLSTIGALSWLRRTPRAWPVAAYPWLYFAAFSIANPLIFRWYLTPPLPFYFLLIFAGVARLGQDLERTRLGRAPLVGGQVARFLLPVFGLLAFGLSLHEWALRPDHGPARPAPGMAWHQLELLYTRVGRELAERVTPETVIAAGDVGALGFFSGARILDTVGLMSPAAAAYYPLEADLYVINYAVPPQLILDRRPDYVVLLEVYGRRGLFRDSRFLAQYSLMEKIPTDIYGSDGMLVFERRRP